MEDTFAIEESRCSSAEVETTLHAGNQAVQDAKRRLEKAHHSLASFDRSDRRGRCSKRWHQADFAIRLCLNREHLYASLATMVGTPSESRETAA